jgi:hypothetical protein
MISQDYGKRQPDFQKTGWNIRKLKNLKSELRIYYIVDCNRWHVCYILVPHVVGRRNPEIPFSWSKGMNMKIFLKLWVLMFLVSAVFAEELAEILKKDPFFMTQQVNVEKISFSRRVFDYSLHRGFYTAVSELERTDLQKRQMAEDWIRGNTPLGLIEYAANHSFQLEFHFGSTHESLFFLNKDGVSEVLQVRSSRRPGFEFLVLPEQNERIGRLIITNINSESELYLLQSYFYCYGSEEKLPFSSELVRIYDFHLTNRESYQTAHMKEYLFAVPFGVKSVVVGLGEEIFSIILRRRFAAMSIEFLRNLYGRDFLRGLQEGIAAAGQKKAQEWQTARFEPLQQTESEVFSAGEYELFLQFESELAALLKATDSPLTKLILIGNELSVHKELVRKSEIMRRLQLVSPRDGSQLRVFALPVETETGKERVLFISGVNGDGVSRLLSVLHNVGLENFYYFGSGMSCREEAGVFLPGTYRFVDDRKVSLNGHNLFSAYADKFGLFQSAEGFHSFSPLLGTSGNLAALAEKGVHFLDESGYYFVQAINELPVNNFGMALAGLSPSAMDSLDGIMGAKNLEQKMADLLVEKLGIKGIPVFAREEDFGFSTLEQKLQHHLARLHVPAEQAVLFFLRLELHIMGNITTPEDMKEYLSDRELRIPGSGYGIDTFLQFVDRPYRDSEIILRLVQYARAIDDLKRFLVLQGEPEPAFRLYGDFVMGRVTPLSPLLLSIENVSQQSLARLLASPFGGQTGGRPMLIRVIPAEDRVDRGETGDLLSYTEEDLFADYFRALALRGVSFQRETRLFTRTPDVYSPDYERILSRVHRWQQGCEVFKLMAGNEFLSRKCNIFSYSTPLPSGQEGNPDTLMMTGINKLKIEGLELMKNITDIEQPHPAFPAQERERLLKFVAGFISALDNFALAFGID